MRSDLSAQDIQSAIFHAARAGGCRKAARVDAESSAVWLLVAQSESDKSSAALNRLNPPDNRVAV